MSKPCKHSIPILLVLLCVSLTACGTKVKFLAPETEPPADLIPSYVPDGFKLVSGFQLSGEVPLRGRLFAGTGDHFDLKSPNGNDIQGIYYQGRDQILLISKSYFPEGTLDLWRSTFETSQPKPCQCDCLPLRLGAIPLPLRVAEIQEERTIAGTRVAILKGPLGWITVFVRGDYLLTVESGLPLEENLKVVVGLLAG